MAAPPDGAPRRSRAAYQRERRKALTCVYFRSVEERERFQAAARASGYASFSAWIVDTLDHATRGGLPAPGYVAALEADNDRLRRGAEAARREAIEARRQSDVGGRQRDALVHVLREIGRTRRR